MLAHDFPFDPTYGYSLHDLLRVRGPEGPADFADFWRAAYAEALAVPPRPTLRPIDVGDDKVEVYEVEYDGVSGFRVGGWLTRPRGVAVVRGLVMSHGYGGRQAPDLRRTTIPTAILQPCARGFDRSARPDLPRSSAFHVLHGIDRRDTYLIRACVQDLWSGVTALAELVPEAAQRLDLHGVSFGGGLGGLAIPWDPRLSKAFLGVPTFSNQPLRVRFECNGSNQAVRLRWLRDPSVLDVLAYYDSTTAARYVEIPVAVHAAPFDPAVPPPGQFCVYNELAGPKALGITTADHFEYPWRPAELAELDRRLESWFAGERDDLGDCRLSG